MSKIIIIGSGISGCTAALELADLGNDVTVLDSLSEIGGKVMSYCCKATDECSLCGVCVAHTCITDAIAHKRIKFITNMSITSVKTTNKNVEITIKRNAASKRITGDAVIVAIGHQVYNATQKADFGYGRLKGVITSEEAEHILASQAYLVSPSDDVAFIQCVGSIDFLTGRNYCSALCCSYATRIARILKHRNPNVNVSIYFIDLQNFTKDFSHLHKKITDEDIRFVRTIPISIDHTAKGKLRLKLAEANGTKATVEHDVVVLFVGMEPPKDSSRIAGLFALKQDSFGFFKSELPNIFVTGTCVEPQSIPDCIASARATAAKLITILPHPKKQHKTLPVAANTGVLSVRLLQKILVIGSGFAGARTAKRLHDFGYKVTIIEKEDTIGGLLTPAMRKSLNFNKLISSANVLTGANVSRISGNVGKFRVTIESENESKENNYGAIVICTGAMAPKTTFPIIDSDQVMLLSELKPRIDKLPKQNRPHSVAILLDVHIEESKASTEIALQLSIALRRLYGIEPYVFCREIRIADVDLETLYDEARNCGVYVVKYNGNLNVRTFENQILIAAHDTLLNENINISCDIAGVSLSGLEAHADPALVVITGVDTDQDGQMQKNNIHMLPERTNRKGVFAVGACRGQYYLADIARDADSAALKVHALLCQKHITLDLPIAIVDPEKCVLCLTCIRICPHKAMIVDRKKNVAACIPIACQQCELCVAECPARAIELKKLTTK